MAKSNPLDLLRYVTFDLLIMMVITMLLLLWRPRLAQQYTLIPSLGLALTVLVVRQGFDIVVDLDWIIRLKASLHNRSSLGFYLFNDFACHFFPAAVILHLMYALRHTLPDALKELPRHHLAMLALSPSFFVLMLAVGNPKFMPQYLVVPTTGIWALALSFPFLLCALISWPLFYSFVDEDFSRRFRLGFDYALKIALVGCLGFAIYCRALDIFAIVVLALLIFLFLPRPWQLKTLPAMVAIIAATYTFRFILLWGMGGSLSPIFTATGGYSSGVFASYWTMLFSLLGPGLAIWTIFNAP